MQILHPFIFIILYIVVVVVEKEEEEEEASSNLILILLKSYYKSVSFSLKHPLIIKMMSPFFALVDIHIHMIPMSL